MTDDLQKKYAGIGLLIIFVRLLIFLFIGGLRQEERMIPLSLQEVAQLNEPCVTQQVKVWFSNNAKPLTHRHIDRFKDQCLKDIKNSERERLQYAVDEQSRVTTLAQRAAFEQSNK